MPQHACSSNRDDDDRPDRNFEEAGPAGAEEDFERYRAKCRAVDAAALAHRMGHRGVSQVVVAHSDGTLVGLFFAADLPS